MMLLLLLLLERQRALRRRVKLLFLACGYYEVKGGSDNVGTPFVEKDWPDPQRVVSDFDRVSDSFICMGESDRLLESRAGGTGISSVNFNTHASSRHCSVQLLYHGQICYAPRLDMAWKH